jgi:hypothetical protein
VLFIAVAAVVFISRISFLDAGYGCDADAWRVVNTAKHIARSGEYSVSRYPGYPVQELICSLLWRNETPLPINGATALLSALGIAFFTLTLKHLNFRDYIPAGLALAFTPVVFINSTNAMDYMWALSFILGSFYFVVLRKPILAGFFLGLGIGCRLTSGAMIIPFILLFVQKGDKKSNFRILATFITTTCVVAVLAFMPVFMQYGTGFFRFGAYRYPSLKHILTQISTVVWGRIGFITIVIAVILTVCRYAALPSRRVCATPGGRRHMVVWAVAIALYLIAFLRLPLEAGYLIPVVPFVVLLLGIILERPVFIMVCAGLIVSSFFSFDSSGIVKGPILVNHARRLTNLEIRNRILSLEEDRNEKSVIVTGHWEAMLRESGITLSPRRVNGTFIINNNENLRAAFLLREGVLHRYLARGYTIYYLPDIRQMNINRYGIDLDDYGAKPLLDN